MPQYLDINRTSRPDKATENCPRIGQIGSSIKTIVCLGPPISIASVALRHFHRIFAKRFEKLSLIDIRQRLFRRADGVAKNLFLLDSILKDFQRPLSRVPRLVEDVRFSEPRLDHLGNAGCLLDRRCGVLTWPALRGLYLSSVHS